MVYRRSIPSRVRAFFFTDRIGHTIASTLGFFAIMRWWIRRRVDGLLSRR